MSHIVLPRDVKTCTSKRERLESAPRDKQLRVFSLELAIGARKEKVEGEFAKKLRELESRSRKDKQA